MRTEILFINEDKKNLDILIESLREIAMVTHVKPDYKFKTEKRFQFVFVACDYHCLLDTCLRKFLFIYSHREIPSALLRSVLISRGSNSVQGFLISFLKDFKLSAEHERIIESLKSSPYYSHNFEKMFHLSDPILKIAKVQRKVAENPRTKWNLSTLSRTIGRCQSWTSSRFKNMTGMSLEHFILKTRLCLSFWDIVSSAKPVKAIALEMGYRPASFTRSFRSIFGSPPSCIRKDFFRLSAI